MSAARSGLNPEASSWGPWTGATASATANGDAGVQAGVQSGAQPESASRGRRGRGGRGGGRGRGGRRPTEGEGSRSGPAEPMEQPPRETQPPRQPQPRQTSGRGRGRGRGRGSASVVPVRAFGSQLTSAGPPAAAAEAASQGTSRAPRNRRRGRASNAAAEESSTPDSSSVQPPSTADDLPTRIHEDIDSGNYDCPICLSAVTRTTRVWSCGLCYHVAHAACVAAWVSKALEQGVARDKIRCPACNSADERAGWGAFSARKLCWCGKQSGNGNGNGNNKTGPAPAALPPHSCGRVCGRPRLSTSTSTSTTTCEHTCPRVCHAGPCPPCTEMGPLTTCFCGKQSSVQPCAAVSADAGMLAWSCGAPCGQLLACGVHRCARPCHADACGPCREPVPSTCYCGKAVDPQRPCCDRSMPPKRSWSPATQTPFEGSFACAAICGRAFDCGVHVCRRPCHAQDEHPPHCPTATDTVTHCRCGKTPLALLTASGGVPARTACTDPVPSCGAVCGKTLPGCGHPCTATCHDAAQPCPPCPQLVDDVCACHQTTRQVVCGLRGAEDSTPQCDTVCRAWLNCKQHRCTNVCCPGRPKAALRTSQSRRKTATPAASSSSTDFEAEHMCLRPCGRPLKCGRHACPQTCHKGACHSCVAYLHDALRCPCGRTAVEPPYLCGTTLPRCDFDCPRPLPCGHPPVPHRCHDVVGGGDGQPAHPCPRCQRLVTKSCLCGKLVLQKVACGADNIQCNNTCGALLRCGTHKCRLGCHAPGRCEDAASAVCGQTCGRPKPRCGHPCTAPCHGATSPCSEAEPCASAVEIHCACGRLTKRVRCNVSEASSDGNADDVDDTTTPARLACDDECLRIQRNLALRDALRVSDDYQDDHLAYSAALMEYFLANRAFAVQHESALRSFAAAAHDDDSAKGLRFKPMKRHERQFVHALAEVLGLRSEAHDAEPHRFVVVVAGKDKEQGTALPELTLAESEEIYLRLKERQQQRAADEAALAALAASDVAKEQAMRERQREKEKEKEKEQERPVLLPPFNAIFVPAAALPSPPGTPPLAADAFHAILEAWQQTAPARATDRAVLTECALEHGGHVLKVDMTDTSSSSSLQLFLQFLLSYLVDPAALPSATAHLCHVDAQGNVLRRSTSDAGDDQAADAQWNIVAGRTERSGGATVPPSSSSSSPSSSSPHPQKRIFTLRKKVLTPVRALSTSAAAAAAARTEAERRRWMDILAAQPTDDAGVAVAERVAEAGVEPEVESVAEPEAESVNTEPVHTHDIPPEVPV